jgi:hypothetical protein
MSTQKIRKNLPINNDGSSNGTPEIASYHNTPGMSPGKVHPEPKRIQEGRTRKIDKNRGTNNAG